MRLRNYASKKVVLIVVAFMVTITSMIFQHRQIKNLEEQIEQKKIAIEQMYDSSQTQIDPATIQAELNQQCEFKILDGTINIKHTYNYAREGLLGMDHTRKITGTADFYYEVTTDLRDAKVTDANDSKITVVINGAQINLLPCSFTS